MFVKNTAFTKTKQTNEKQQQKTIQNNNNNNNKPKHFPPKPTIIAPKALKMCQPSATLGVQEKHWGYVV